MVHGVEAALEIVIDGPEALGRALVERFERVAHGAIRDRGRFACALTGGSLATTFFPRLATATVDWRRLEVFWGDERAVPPSDPDSNFGLARRLWLDQVPLEASRLHRMRGEAEELEAEAAAYAAEMVRILGAPPALDLALLGVGPDGHVCSLFPGHPALRETRAWVVAVHDAPKPPPRRLTLTLPTLGEARALAIVALGGAKADVVRAAIEDEASTLPVAQAARRARQAVFFLDVAAAGRLNGGGG